MKLDVFQHIVGTKNGIEVTEYTPVVHARWIEDADEMTCSNCGKHWNYCDNDTHTFNHCPNCGAKMDEGANE